MKVVLKRGVRGTMLAPFLAVACAAIVIGGSLVHPASLQEPLKALGLMPITGGVAAPEFRLADLEGTMVSLQDHRGKVVMLYFWTTW